MFGPGSRRLDLWTPNSLYMSSSDNRVSAKIYVCPASIRRPGTIPAPDSALPPASASVRRHDHKLSSVRASRGPLIAITHFPAWLTSFLVRADGRQRPWQTDFDPRYAWRRRQNFDHRLNGTRHVKGAVSQNRYPRQPAAVDRIHLRLECGGTSVSTIIIQPR